GGARRAGLGGLGEMAGTILYHKIGSTLRGNWAAELMTARASIADATGVPPLAVIAPAFPARGRITRQGRVLVAADAPAGGEARATVAMTDAGEGAAPLRGFWLAVSGLDTDALGAPVAALAAPGRALAPAGADAIVCDAATDAHLAAIATAVRLAGIAVLWVGSAGLMRPLAAAVGPTGGAALPKPGAAAGPLLMVVGSATAVSCAQFEALVADPDVVRLRVDAAELQAHAGGPQGPLQG